METTTCPFCREDIKVGALKCKHCGTNLTSVPAGYDGNVKKEGTLWLPLPSMIIGIIATLALFDDSEWDIDVLIGLFVMGITGLVLGIVSLNTQKAGKGMAIAGVVLSSIVLLAGVGLLAE